MPGEGGRARDIERLLAAGADHDALARAGVGWVVVEVRVTRIGGDHPAASHRGLLIAAHLAWLAVLFGGFGGLLAGLVKRRDTADR